MMIGARTGAWAQSVGGVEWKNPYITDGLVAMWDGINNAGTGEHQSYSMTWVDCVGGIVANLNKGESFSKTYIFDNDSVVLDNTFSFKFVPNENINQILTSDHTVEFLFMCGQPELVDSVPLFGFGSYTNSFMSIGGRQDSIKSRLGINNEVQVIGKRNKPNLFSVTMNRSTGVAVGYSNAQMKTTVDRVSQSSPATTGRILGEDNVFFGGSGMYWLDPPIDGHAYCLRVYSRALSAAEISANYTVDKARFNLP